MLNTALAQSMKVARGVHTEPRENTDRCLPAGNFFSLHGKEFPNINPRMAKRSLNEEQYWPGQKQIPFRELYSETHSLRRSQTCTFWDKPVEIRS